MKKMTGGQIVAECFEQLGVEYYLGYNGHGIWNILNALIEKPQIKGIQPKHEISAVHIADGYFRAKHRVVPVMASVGPGVLNLISPIGNAMLDSSGILIIPTGPPTHYLDRSSLEELSVHAGDDVPNIFRPITKRIWNAIRPDILAYQIVQAYKLAGTGRPGPTAVYIPFDVSAHELEVEDGSLFSAGSLNTKMGGEPQMIKKAATLLLAAKKPLLVAGGGVHVAEAWEEVKDFVEGLGVPLVTSMPGKGVFPENHPLCLGPVGRSGWESAVNATREADVILAVGCRFCDANTSGWRKGVVYNFPDTKLIHVNIDQLDIGRNYPADVGIVGDAKTVLRQVIESVKGDWSKGAKDREAWVHRAKKWKEEWVATIERDIKGPEAPISTNRLAYEINRGLPKDANVVTDTGDIQQAYEGYGIVYTPNTFFNNAGLAQMGWASSAVMGVKLARPHQVALAIVGDGSFLMSNYALATAVEYKINVIWVIINNYGQSIERHGQLINYGREVWSTFERDGKPYNPDFVKMAESYGVKAKRIQSSDEVGETIKKGIQMNEPYLIEVVTDRNAPTYFCPGITRGYPVRWDKLAYLKQ
jgi:acetolactate synthase-1/2/3 large subunit